MVRQKRNIDFGFWVNFRQEDRICRKEDCGAAALAALLRASRLRRDASSYALRGSGVTR